MGIPAERRKVRQQRLPSALTNLCQAVVEVCEDGIAPNQGRWENGIEVRRRGDECN
jgi:hypothetical protein